ncbi:SDR family oxidoreductase [bacterium]|nr:SDR family oxidoreductase [bacterium]
MPKVLVTGASSGLGRAIAVALAQKGWEVFAGVRGKEDGPPFSGKGVIRPLVLDITDPKALSALPSQIGERLDALVNNAGIVRPGPLEILPLSALREQLEVNVVGQVAVTQAVLPALRERKGRIAFISSTSGLVTFPFLGAYAASKHALEAVGDAFRRELQPWSIDVSLIEPGPIRTPIWKKTRDFVEENKGVISPQSLSLYEKGIEIFESGTTQAEERAEDASVVVAAVLHALLSERPRTRYIVGPRSRWRTVLARFLPDRWLDRRLGGS